MKQTFLTYASEADAIADMKQRRKRKYSITYSAYWNCFVCWFNI